MDENVGASARKGCYVPQDIIHNILKILPLKTLIRFKSVCQIWRNMISELDLRQLMAKVMIIYPAHPSMGKLFFKLNEDGIDACFSFKSNDIWAVKACKNFVLFRSYHSMLYVYDSIHHLLRLLPQSPVPTFCFQATDIFRSSETCKVVVLDKNHCFICRLNDESWKTLSFSNSQKITQLYSSVEVNGVFYWLAKGDGDYDDAFIQPLDIATEELMNIIKVPYQPWGVNCYLLKMKGSLCYVNTASNEDLQIWALTDSVESLWIEIRRISLQSMVPGPYCLTSFISDRFHPCLVIESINATYILVTIKDISTPFWYVLETNELKHIAVNGYNNLKADNFYTLSFIDSDVVPELKDLRPDSEDLIRELRRRRRPDFLGFYK